MATKMETLIIAVVLISIIVSGSGTYYLANQLLGELAAMREDIKKLLGEYEEATFTYSWVTDMTGFDPAVAWTTDARKVQQFGYESLLKLKGSTADLEGSLATTWTVSTDGLTYTFNLREGVKFADGSPFNATAVKATFERLLGIGLQSKNYKMSKEINIKDTYTVEFVLEYPFAPFLAAQAVPTASIVNPNALEKHKTTDDPYAKDWFHEHINGTGPYMLKEWVKGEKWTMVQNPNYWRGWEGKHITKIVGVVVPEPAVSRLMLEKGELDANYFISMDDIESLKANPNMKVVSYPGYGKYWSFNCQKPPTDDVHFRKAIAYAFDYEQALALIYGYGAQARSNVFPSSWGYDPNGFMYERNITKAKEELAQSAYPDGGVTIKVIWCAGVDMQRKLNVLLKTNLMELDINLEIEGKEWATFAQLQTNLETSYHMSTFNMMMFLPDPHESLYRWHSSNIGTRNYGWYVNPEYDALVDQAMQETDQETRQQLYWQAIDILFRQDCTDMMIFYEDRFVVLGKWVYGFVGNTFLCETFGNPWFMWTETAEKI